MVLKFLNGLLKSPRATEDPTSLARAYSDCQARITVLQAELERLTGASMGYLDDAAQSLPPLDDAFAGLELVRTYAALRAEMVRSNDLKSRLDSLCCGTAPLDVTT